MSRGRAWHNITFEPCASTSTYKYSVPRHECLQMNFRRENPLPYFCLLQAPTSEQRRASMLPHGDVLRDVSHLRRPAQGSFCRVLFACEKFGVSLHRTPRPPPSGGKPCGHRSRSAFRGGEDGSAREGLASPRRLQLGIRNFRALRLSGGIHPLGSHCGDCVLTLECDAWRGGSHDSIPIILFGGGCFTSFFLPGECLLLRAATSKGYC